jgi:nicotinamide riboside kinase
MGIVIALLGAESTGKTDLARMLARRTEDAGLRTAVVEEYLREFCDARQRTPRVDEQAHIAEEQTRRIDEAAASHDVVFADTTALMTAVYSEFIFADTTLYPAALDAHRRCRVTLLTGLDMPWLPDGLQRDGPHVREPVDALLRRQLQAAALPYHVIYGLGTARVEAAWRAIAPVLAAEGLLTAGQAAAPPPPLRWRYRCRECLVPECEHLGFTRLIREGGSAGRA